MGLQYRKRIKIFPGVTLNVSNSGLSVTFGFRGFHFTVGRGRTRTTVSLPGTGISYSKETSSR